MIDHLSPKSFQSSKSIVPIHFISEEQGLHTLWRRFQIPERSSWKSLINRVFKPLDLGLDHLIDIACKLSPFVAEGRQSLSICGDSRFMNFMAHWRIDSARSTAEEWSSMSDQRLASCMAMLDWTGKNINARYKACVQMSEHLDVHAAHVPEIGPCPQWQPDPEICEYLNWARQRAEQLDRGRSSPAVFILQPLDSGQSGDLVIGLKILNVHFEMKQMERAVRSYVQKFNLARTVAKVGLFAPPIFAKLLQNRASLRFTWPLLGLLCFGSALLLGFRAHAQFQADSSRTALTSRLFHNAGISVYCNFAATRERNERRANRANAHQANVDQKADLTIGQLNSMKAKLQAQADEIAYLRAGLNHSSHQVGGAAL